MEITLSSKGHLVLPAPIRRRLQLKKRSRLEVEERDGRVFLRPKAEPKGTCPVPPLPEGALKFGSRDYALDEFAEAVGEDDRP